MREQLPTIDIKEKLSHLADELDVLQATKNKERGVQCIRNIVAYLRIGKIGDARTVANTDADKIENYPDIKQWLQENLFSGASSDQWYAFAGKDELQSSEY